jgi:hypothetical protein
MAPDLVAAVSQRAIMTCQLGLALVNHAWIADIRGVLSIPVLVQDLELWQHLDQVSLQAGTQDKLEMDGVRPILHAVSLSSDVFGPILSLGR